MPKILGVIPARYNSSRFPGKPLALISGKTMIQRVYECCSKVQKWEGVLVATDDKRIFDEVKRFGGVVVMTATHHLNGTERIAEVAKSRTEDFIINIQGDEPCIHPKQIEELIDFMLLHPEFEIFTQAQPLENHPDLLENPNLVKVGFDDKGKAEHFMRIIQDNEIMNNTSLLGKHIGIYGFKRRTLLELVKLEPTKNELEHRLEQLRWMDHDYGIGVTWTNYSSPSVDVPEDISIVEEILNFITNN